MAANPEVDAGRPEPQIAQQYLVEKSRQMRIAQADLAARGSEPGYWGKRYVAALCSSPLMAKAETPDAAPASQAPLTGAGSIEADGLILSIGLIQADNRMKRGAS